jgi:DNA-binding transcriptional regulator YiaG
VEGSELRRIREKLGLSRDEFATIFGLSGYQSVMNIETDFRRPSKLTMILLRTLDALPLSKAKTIVELLRKHSDV